MSKALSSEYVEQMKFKQLGQRPIWSNKDYQLHLYPSNWGVFKRSDNGVLYKDTNITLTTEEDFENWYSEIQ